MDEAIEIIADVLDRVPCTDEEVMAYIQKQWVR
jgi:hypothetical protein